MRTAEALPEIRLNGEPPPMRGAPREQWAMPEKPDADRFDPPEHIEPPGYGESSRDAIKAIIVGMSEQNGKALAALRSELDELEQLMLVSAARVQAEVEGHAVICRYVHAEVGRLHDIVGKMREAQTEVVRVTTDKRASA
ncbi:hypothetical protein [Bradyrhizobium sp. BRP23]|uniref:hypothetical protein n=1 Tax=Bradyrhizobium sp. BRP23 TaxID=2793820 RepID=UPI001CD3558F|nr:hypothetical protein [Bradyrhizobium sp. BRP23]MCA1419445.1 hypothetical protein [Bradyrhizobium sp. BRP23]